MKGNIRGIRLMMMASVLSFGALALASPKSRFVTVVIENMKFSPAEIEVKKGDSVIWINKDLVPHTVTSDDKRLDSRTIEPGKSWRFRSVGAGAHPYKCIFHPTMLGSVTVK